MADLILRLELDDDAEIVDRDTRALLRQISETVDPDVSLPAGPAEPGTRSGDAVMLGEIAMALVSSGAAVALLDIFKAYFSRKRGAKISVTRADGAQLTIEADDVSGPRFDDCLAQMDAFVAEGKKEPDP